MEDTWFSRDLPALDAAVSLIDEGIDFPEATDIAERSRLDVKDAARALKALKGEYVDLLQETGDPAGWTVSAVTSAARRAVGQWPSPEGLVDALAEAFGSAAEREPDSEKKGRLRQVGSFLSGTGRDGLAGPPFARQSRLPFHSHCVIGARLGEARIAADMDALGMLGIARLACTEQANLEPSTTPVTGVPRESADST